MAAALTPLRIWLKDLFVLLLSMVPIAENRLAIPVAAALRLKWQQAFLCTTAGSFLPVPYVMKGSGRWPTAPAGSALSSADSGGSNGSPKSTPGSSATAPCSPLAVFVGIPFTGIGVWIASFVAGALGFDRALDGRHPRRHGDLGALYHRVHLRGNRRRENALPVRHPGRMNLEAEGRFPIWGSGPFSFPANVV